MWYEFSWKFHFIWWKKSTAVWSKSTLNSMSCIQVLSSMLKHDMDFGQVQVMDFGQVQVMDFVQVQVMEFPWHLLWKWWDFHRIWSHFWPNCPQKDIRKSLSHFLQGKLQSYSGILEGDLKSQTQTHHLPTVTTVNLKLHVFQLVQNNYELIEVLWLMKRQIKRRNCIEWKSSRLHLKYVSFIKLIVNLKWQMTTT